MKVPREIKLLLAVGIAWFVLIDVLLRTSLAAANSLSGSGRLVRSVTTLLSNVPFGYALIGLAVIGIFTLVFFQLVLVFKKTWRDTIALTSLVLEFVFSDNAISDFPDPESKLNLNSLKDNFIKLLSAIFRMWLLILVLEVISSLEIF